MDLSSDALGVVVRHVAPDDRWVCALVARRWHDAVGRTKTGAAGVVGSLERTLLARRCGCPLSRRVLAWSAGACGSYAPSRRSSFGARLRWLGGSVRQTIAAAWRSRGGGGEDARRAAAAFLRWRHRYKARRADLDRCAAAGAARAGHLELAARLCGGDDEVCRLARCPARWDDCTRPDWLPVTVREYYFPRYVARLDLRAAPLTYGAWSDVATITGVLHEAIAARRRVVFASSGVWPLSLQRRPDVIEDVKVRRGRCGLAMLANGAWNALDCPVSACRVPMMLARYTAFGLWVDACDGHDVDIEYTETFLGYGQWQRWPEGLCPYVWGACTLIGGQISTLALRPLDRPQRIEPIT